MPDVASIDAVYDFVGLPAWQFWLVVTMLLTGFLAQPQMSMQPEGGTIHDSDHKD